MVGGSKYVRFALCQPQTSAQYDKAPAMRLIRTGRKGGQVCLETAKESGSVDQENLSVSNN